MSTTQLVIDRIAQKKQELEALKQAQKLSENTSAQCTELNRQLSILLKQYESILNIAKGWSSAFENSSLVEIPQINFAEDESDTPENVVRIPAAETTATTS